jgi:uncharacterized protein (UPF0179 family)
MARDTYSGTHVKCINNSWCATLTEGSIYEVIDERGEEHEYFCVINDKGAEGVYYKERFLIQAAFGLSRQSAITLDLEKEN